MTVNSRVIKTFLSWTPDAIDVPLTGGLRVQILPTMEDLPRARKHQFAAFIASEALLVVWDDEAANLPARAKHIETELMDIVWRAGEPERTADEGAEVKQGPAVVLDEFDPETGELLPEKRPVHLQNTVLVAITLLIVVTMLGAGFREVVQEIKIDNNYIRLLFLLLTPVQIFFTLVSSLSEGSVITY